MKPTLGVDQFSINGIPSDIDKMAAAFPFGWYQISNGLEVNVMARRAWPMYSKHYAPYHYFNPYPGNNWIYQSWELYAEECARLFVKQLDGNYGEGNPLIDIEENLSDSALRLIGLNRTQGNQKYLGMLKIVSDTIEGLIGRVPEFYTGYYFWMALDGSTATWAIRNPLCLAVYPYDNYAQAQYLSALNKVMDGTLQLPFAAVPMPWNKTTHQQFTGRAPVNLIPGYAIGGNWANTVDMNIKLADVPIVATLPSNPKYVALYNINVRATSSNIGAFEGVLPVGSEIYVDYSSELYSHFLPIPSFPDGGWVYSQYISKQ